MNESLYSMYMLVIIPSCSPPQNPCRHCVLVTGSSEKPRTGESCGPVHNYICVPLTTDFALLMQKQDFKGILKFLKGIAILKDELKELPHQYKGDVACCMDEAAGLVRYSRP